MRSKEYREKLNRILELYSLGKTYREIAEKLVEEGLESDDIKLDSVRRKVSRAINGHPAVSKEAESIGINPKDVKSYWYKGKHFSIYVKSPDTVSWEDIKEDIMADIKKYAPRYEYVEPTKSRGDKHCLVIDPADVHIGKFVSMSDTGESYNSQMAFDMCIDGVNGVLDKSSGFTIDQIVFVAGNDILHVDSSRNTTTSGTPQEVDSNWRAMYDAARKLYIKLIEQMSIIAPIHFIHTPSNHDYVNGFFLSEVIKTWFQHHDGVSFDVNLKHRKYFKYGNNVMGFTHGDGAKEKDLPILMAVEAKDYWANCDHRYMYTHHVHHKTSKDYPGITIESLRSPSAADSWHHKMGYQHAVRAIEGFIHHENHGQVARISHIFNEY